MGEYTFTLEDGEATLDELMPLYRQHYAEMRERRNANGENLPEFNPRVDEYCRSWRSGDLLNYVVRNDGQAVGYSNVYITNDMHNRELIAQEDTVFVLKEHRNGTGRKLVKTILEDLRARGVKRIYITPVTDLRVGKIWARMGFKSVADLMIYTF